MKNKLPDHIIPMVESLNQEQLHAVHQLVSERLNLFHKVQALRAMSEFHVLDRVSFAHNGIYYEGSITRLNQKTISVVLDDGHQWNVSPGFLKKIGNEKNTSSIQQKKR